MAQKIYPNALLLTKHRRSISFVHYCLAVTRGCRIPYGFKGAGLSSMRNPLRRYYGLGDLQFVTFSCYWRRPFLGTRRAGDHFIKNLDTHPHKPRDTLRLAIVLGDALR